MKNFKQFKLSNLSMNKLIGGLVPVQTSDSWTDDNGCKVKKTDTFEDCNNDGIWNKDEEGTTCTETICK